ncbi:hypothetical protein WMY93_025163 [Mugilogobius chulae]|uniref:Reverse transcriptase n=1 Tax=Mugilogobius chulae TaxID=88201 RepID=A0AAW0N4V8_9GOBI
MNIGGTYHPSTDFIIPPEIISPPIGTPAKPGWRRRRYERRRRGKRAGMAPTGLGTVEYSRARSALRKTIKAAKGAYKRRIEAHFDTSANSREVWQGIRASTLADELNLFYARFDRDNKEAISYPLPSGGSTTPSLDLHQVRLCLRNINPRKAAGPDGVLGRVLKDCADELAEVFTNIFNLSLSTSWVPTCFKAATIIPVPKQTNVTCLND